MQNLSKRTKITAFCILLSAICILLWSCFNPFSPSVIGPGALKPIAPQVNPDSVLYNFKYSYENRDSVVYENCLDPEFVFFYRDQDQYTNIEEEMSVPRDGIGGDIYRTKFLFRVFEDIHLDTWKTTASYDTLVDGQTWKVRRVEFHLLLQDMDGEYQSMGAYGYADFLFRQSDKDNFWRIVRWVDRSI
jgi:hypothetical protein